VTLHNLGRGPVLFRHGLRRKEKQHSLYHGNSLFLSFSYLLFFLPLFLGIRKEVRRERWIVQEDAGVHKGDCLLL
jgi:hypothetical protein